MSTFGLPDLQQMSTVVQGLRDEGRLVLSISGGDQLDIQMKKMTPTSHHTQNLNNSRVIIDSSENSETIRL